MDGDIVEKVVPLAAREDIDGSGRVYAKRFDDTELTDSALLLVETGLTMPVRATRACSMADISLAVRCIVEKLTGPLRSDRADSERGGNGIGGAVPGIRLACEDL